MSDAARQSRGAPIVGALVMRATVVAELVLGAWLLGRVCSDRFLWSQFLLWIPTPIAILTAIAATLVAWRPDEDRRRRMRRGLGWTTALIIVLAWFGGIEHTFLRRAGVPSDGALSVAHWEMGGAFASEDDGPTADAILDALDADIVILTNINSTWGRSFDLDAVAGRRGYTRRHLRGFLVVADVLARVPMEITSLDELGEMRAALWRLRTECAGRAITIDVVDLPSDPRDERMHFARRIRAKLDNKERPQVVVGDINMTRGGAALRHAFPGFHHAYDDGGRGYAATFRRGLPLYHIDHMLLDDTIRCDRYELIDLGAGRHLAQRAWLSMEQ